MIVFYSCKKDVVDRNIDNLQQGLLQIDAWWNTISERISKFAYNILDVKNLEE